MHATLSLAAALLFLTGPEGRPAGSVVQPAPGQVTLTQCLVSLVAEAQVPAQEAGILVEVTAREGQQVAAGERLARIDDSQTLSAHQVAALKLDMARERSANNINVRYAQAASDVARVEYEQAWKANQKSSGTIADSEIRRLYLSDRKALLAIEQAALEQRLAALEAKVYEAEATAASVDVQRRQINSPLDGVVVRVNRRQGEWVQPGDPVLHVVRMDRLRIEGFLGATDVRDRDGRVTAKGYPPAHIHGRPVTVTVELAEGRRETFQGKVVFVSPMVQAGSEYRFWAEVVNRREDDQWLLLPGMTAEMTVHLQ